ncbi:uncharacterized protein BJ171DRAFT_422005 [Polychytrium aggregatum]|uniref:uncharacterized protein n=1 Tax=Polychytrium aggregatum TaxID=110093 RepID=UPI0022FEB065|nr:uncharacterized protein BJ171DRAFT_422005 [Polychytrium aggregatum]KAI9206302.1 hypothetical protein BJ171DRAFT_422005 [Polychytrium aggregatum]
MTHSAISYENKLILAPMVRVGSTPMRLMSLKYGADLVYSPEIVDKRLIRATRIVNELLGTVDFVDSIDRSLTLRIHHSEKDRLVVQMGTANPELAVQAALKVAGDCAAIDVNCGCPKRFSVISNMGAALLTQPELLCSILTNLVQNVPLPITCKIRWVHMMLRTPEETIELAKRLEATGIKALALHCRTKKMTEKDKGQWSIFKPVREALSIPLIANGDCFKAEDVDKLKRLTGVSSVMVARGAQKNISIFRGPGNQLDPWDVMVDYCKTAIELDMPFHNAKYTLLTMWSNVRKSRGESPQRISRTRSMRQVW